MGGWVESSNDARTDDPFEGTYEVLSYGRVRFLREVILTIPMGKSWTSILVAPAGMVRTTKWLAQRRADYAGARRQ